MSRDASGLDSEVGDEGDGLALLRRAAPGVLKSLTDPALNEVVRILLAAGAGLAAVLAWGVDDWLLGSSARWGARLDGLATAWAAKVLGGGATAAALRDSQVGAYTREAASVFMFLGGLLGLGGGAAGGLMARSARRAAKAGAGGAFGGALVGGAVSLMIVPIYLGLLIQTPDIRLSIAGRMLVFAAMATACGLAAGVGARTGALGTLTLATAGAMGGGLGALVFELIQVLGFPFEPEFVPIPRTSLCRLIAYGCATLVAAVCVATVLEAPPTADATAGGAE